MLKGFFDRLLIPGVAYDPKTAKPKLDNIKKIVGVVTYGQSRIAAFWMGEASRKTVTQFLPWFTGGKARAKYLALYKIDEFHRAGPQGLYRAGGKDDQRALNAGYLRNSGFRAPYSALKRSR